MFTAVKIENVLWFRALYNLVGCYRRFGRTWFSIHASRNILMNVDEFSSVRCCEDSTTTISNDRDDEYMKVSARDFMTNPMKICCDRRNWFMIIPSFESNTNAFASAYRPSVWTMETNKRLFEHWNVSYTDGMQFHAQEQRVVRSFYHRWHAELPRRVNKADIASPPPSRLRR